MKLLCLTKVDPQQKSNVIQFVPRFFTITGILLIVAQIIIGQQNMNLFRILIPINN